MSGVVMRCSNCGTAQATPGECEACREAQVRRFCTNHAPGLWLDAATCPRCGARFGKASPVPATPPPRVAKPAERRRAIRKPPPPSPGPRSPGEPTPTGLGGDDIVSMRDAMTRRWLERLASASPLGGMPRERRREPGAVSPEPTGGGCLRRLLVLALVLLGLFLVASLVLGGALLSLL